MYAASLGNKATIIQKLVNLTNRNSDIMLSMT